MSDFPDHLSHDEYLRRRIRDVDASLQNLADIVLPRLEALERGEGWAWIPPGAPTSPGLMAFHVLEKKG